MFYETKPNSGAKPWTFQSCTLDASLDTPTLAIGTVFPHQEVAFVLEQASCMFYETPRNVFSGNTTTKTNVVVPVSWFVVVTVGAAKVVVVVVPTATTQNPGKWVLSLRRLKNDA